MEISPNRKIIYRNLITILAHIINKQNGLYPLTQTCITEKGTSFKVDLHCIKSREEVKQLTYGLGQIWRETGAGQVYP